ncbi:hypothetical protein F4818DRAFT_457468 [Hypoxylon cercidicola]|nr:hypothetical protein F4818DRAFT_457468 [Hypoxylon cercidicola]
MGPDLILLGIGVVIIVLRIYMRVTTFGWKGLMADDYLMLAVVAPYSALAVAMHISICVCKGLSNDRMTAEQRGSLEPGSEEYSLRIRGAKFVLFSQVLYVLTMWLTKAAMLAFYKRLTDRFGAYRTRIHVGFLLLGVTWLADFLATMLSCQPFYKNWQINPDPGRQCYPDSAPYNPYGTLCLNITTSLYILFVPLPILWMADTKFWKKLGLVLLISGNGFVIVAACLRSIYMLTTPEDDGEPALRDRWKLQVCFVALVTTNLPLFFPFISRWISLLIGARPTSPQLRTITTTELSPGSTAFKSRRFSRADSGVFAEKDPQAASKAHAANTV